jgi:hypothetical protein
VGTRSLCTSLGGFPRLKGPELGTRKVGDTTDVSTGFARISESKIKVIFDSETLYTYYFIKTQLDL